MITINSHLTKKKQTTPVNKEQTIADFIEWAESREYKIYSDSKGIPTIGVGRNLKNNPLSETETTYFMRKYGLEDEASVYKKMEAGIDDEDINFLLDNDIAVAKANAKKVIPYLGQLPSNIQYVIIDLVFNMGVGKFRKFKKFLGAIGSFQHTTDEKQKQAYINEAGYQLADSVYTLDVQRRCVRNVKHLGADIDSVIACLANAGKTEYVNVLKKWRNVK